MGTVTALGVPNSVIGVAAYDVQAITGGKVFAEAFPAIPSDLLSSNYYDLSFSLYTLYYRTGDPYWLDKASYVAQVWSDGRENT